jgi:hypothetical protein
MQQGATMLVTKMPPPPTLQAGRRAPVLDQQPSERLLSPIGWRTFLDEV